MRRDLREFRHKNEASSSRAAEEARAAAAEIAALRAEVARRAEVAQRLDNGQHDSEIKVANRAEKLQGDPSPRTVCSVGISLEVPLACLGSS